MSLTGKLKCIICDYERETFICCNCISEGNFSLSDKRQESLRAADSNKRSKKNGGKGSASKAPNVVKFSEKKARLRELEEENKEINDIFAKMMEKKQLRESLEVSIIELTLKNKVTRELLAASRLQVAILAARRAKLKEKLESSHHNREDFIDELTTARRQLVKVKKRLNRANNDFDRIRNEVKEATKNSMLLLKERVFPFYCDKGFSDSTATNSVDENYSSKEGSLFIADSETDSFSTTCCPPSMGSWAAVESNCQRYYIVEPWIPKYSVAQPYINWLNKMEETCKLSPIGEPDGDDRYIINNDAYRVSAALSYITQLLELASFITDVRFPKRLSFVEFFTKFNDSTEIFLTEDEILHKVAKLNTNLIHLCLSQKVAGRLIAPTNTGHNLSLLFDPNYAHYTKSGPLYIDRDSHRRVEDALYHDYIRVESPYENHDFPTIDDMGIEECIGPDWESVPSSPVLATYDLYTSQQSTTSMTGGIMSVAETALYSITSFIRRQ